jgi:hypothetical protein
VIVFDWRTLKDRRLARVHTSLRPQSEWGTHLNLNGSEIFLANQPSSASEEELGFEFELRGAAIELSKTLRIPTAYAMQFSSFEAGVSECVAKLCFTAHGVQLRAPLPPPVSQSPSIDSHRFKR